MRRWDAGELGCGQMAAELRRRIDALEPGESIEVVTSDLGAPTDLPAWCRMTGHTLVSATPPVYILRRKQKGDIPL
mgnify:FL=1